VDVVVSLEHHFDRTPDGRIWTRTNFEHGFWTRYLDVFDRVRVVARVRDSRAPEGSWRRADGEAVSFAPVPDYLGPWQYIRRRWHVVRASRSAVGSKDAIIMRVASQIAACIDPLLRKSGRPYGLEVVSDPYDVFGAGVVRRPLRPFFRWWFPRQLRRHCAGACAVGYVTERALQRRYAAAPKAFTTHDSDVELPECAFVSTPRMVRPGAGAFRILTVGSLAQLYKAPDVLLDAVAACAANGLDLRVDCVGDGKHRAELESRASRLGLGERARFLGELPAGEAVRKQMDRADLFVLPSRAEGLPRAMIEAMARSLPCIGSSVGGIPELLASEDMVPPGDPKALAAKIREVATTPGRMERMSTRNLAKAKEYHEGVLRKRRIAFYKHLREETGKWVNARGG